MISLETKESKTKEKEEISSNQTSHLQNQYRTKKIKSNPDIFVVFVNRCWHNRILIYFTTKQKVFSYF